MALYEYYKIKNGAKRIKEEEMQQGLRERSRSPSPIIIEVAKPKRIKKRSYRHVHALTSSENDFKII